MCVCVCVCVCVCGGGGGGKGARNIIFCSYIIFEFFMYTFLLCLCDIVKGNVLTLVNDIRHCRNDRYHYYYRSAMAQSL